MDLGISSAGGEKKWQFDQWQGRRFYDITPGCRTNENNNNNNNNNNNDNNHYYHHLCSVRVAQNITTRGPRKKSKTKKPKKKKTKQNKKKNKPKKLETNKIAM